ncbi:trypsin-like serine peptidase [Streptomyces xinghaiensis]|uniref:trypsin-like serine peptidase n=1 Tax=Streptomyces xinghaiensis TaxID=1038928 RepID=UPI0012FFBA2F|nr:serine protease [Streptomyces xinghaiensis]
MTTHDGLDSEALERLRVLTERNVVGIRAGQAFCGTGFLVTPDTVLTCAHVVAGRGEGSVTAMVGGRTVAVEVVSLVPEAKGAGSTYGFPDLAEVRLSEPAHDVRGVWLGSAGPRQAAAVSIHGFSGHTLEPGVQPDTLHLTVAGRSGRFVRLQWDQVVQGFSGSPVLDTTTGRVCGVLKASRHERGMSGGWLIPVDAVEECSPGLLERNHAAHRPGTVWFDLARDRKGRQAGLFGPEPGGLSPRNTPAQMLARGAMPFVDRPELGELQNWCWELDDQLLRLLYARAVRARPACPPNCATDCGTWAGSPDSRTGSRSATLCAGPSGWKASPPRSARVSPAWWCSTTPKHGSATSALSWRISTGTGLMASPCACCCWHVPRSRCGMR